MIGMLRRWWNEKPPPPPPLTIVCEKYINAGLAGISGHWLVCQRCTHEWKDLLRPDPWDGRRWHYCPRCGVQALGSRILADYAPRAGGG